MSIVTVSTSGQTDSVGFKSDLRIFKGALEDTHPNLYRFTPKERFEIVFDSIDRQITSKTNQLDYFRLLSRIEFLVREGHTYLRPSESLSLHVQQQGLFPFHVLLNDKTIIVKKSLEENHKACEGLEVYSINGKKTDEIINQIANSTGLKSGYNNSALLNILSFENNFAFAYYYYVDTSNTFLVEFKSGNPVEVQGINVATGEAFPKFAKEDDPPINLQIDSANGTALIKITTFAHWTVSFSKKEYVKTFSNYFNKIEKTGIKNLIIDVRNNRGGEELLAAELLTYLTISEFKIYKNIKAKTLNFDYDLPNATKLHFSKGDYLKTDSGYFKIKDEALITFSPKIKNHFNGKVYVLSNGGSSSATNTMLSLIRTYRVGTIIGQESGGVCEDVDGRKRINLTLPYSGIQLSFPAWSFKINSSNGDRVRGVIPDYIVTTSKLDLMDDSIDRELELAYNLIKED